MQLKLIDQNRYKDLESLLFLGFIPYKATIGGVDFVFKSLNDIEYETIQLMSGIEKESSHYFNNFHLNYLFFSIYMINGINILSKRQEVYLDAKNILKGYPTVLINSFFKLFESISKRLNTCSKLLEPYSYENISRYNWSHKKTKPLNSICYTGVHGTDQLGLNYFQKYWASLNIREDQKESFEEKYSLFKFLASFTDSKAVRKIEATDKTKKEEEENKRKRIIEYGTEEERTYLSKPIDTRESIIEELERQMRGEKDEHDKIIEEYEKNLRKDMLKQMQELKRMRDERKKQKNFVIEEARPISPQEMEMRLKATMEKKINFQYMDTSDNELKSKFLQMSNVTNEDVIKKEKIMSENEYQELINDELFKSVHNPDEEIEKEYKKNQKKLAYEYGLDEEDNSFPNLRGK